LPLQPPERWAVLLDSLGIIEDEGNIIVLGRDGPDLMCALLRAGAPQVTHLCSHERLDADSASLVIIPQLSSPDWLESHLPSIRRALAANGRFAVCVDPLVGTPNRVRRILTQHGFVAIRASRATGRTVLCAEVPAFGLRRCA
jgi:hypothetical protein